MEIIKTTCSMCSSKCGMNAHVDNNRIIKITNMKEHLLNRLCPKSVGIPELLDENKRLTDPLVKSNGKWKKTSWDEALSRIAEKLLRYKADYGPESLLVFVGYPWNSSHPRAIMEHFTNVYGTPNFTNDGSVCFRARMIGGSLTAGRIISVDYSGEDQMKCRVFWGENPSENWPPHAISANKLIKNGGKLIVIDARATPAAKKADIFAQIKPGTDCALALGMLNVIINEGLYDKAFVEKWTVGFDELVEHVKNYTPEKVEKITGVPAEKIVEMARMYATNGPGCISTGISVEHSTNGIQALRAIFILIGITGNLDVPGGNKYSPKLKLKTLKADIPIDKKMAVGARYFPIFSKFTHQTSYLPVIEQLLTDKPYSIKALIVAGGNPVLTWPNTHKVMKGFQRVEFKVVIDVFMTETAEMADIVLPGSTFLERSDLRNYTQHYGEPLFVLTHPAVKPVGNAKEDWWIWAELGKKMGYGKYFPWENDEDLIADLLEPSGIRIDDLKQNPAGVPYAEREYRQYLNEGFSTRSGKFEIYSDTMKEFGYDPLPTYKETPVPQEQAQKYPLTLITIRKNAYTHSQYRTLPSLKKKVPEPYVEMNPLTAKKYNINEGDRIKVESEQGFIKAKAKLTKDISPELIGTLVGWGGDANINRLTDDGERDPVSGYPSFKPRCRVVKI